MTRARMTTILTLCLALLPFGATAQVLDPLDLTGRDFAGIRLPMAPVEGSMTFSAIQATVWQEGDATRRIWLEGDVEVELGLYRFQADQACVWIRRNDDGTTQAFTYFANVRTPPGENARTSTIVLIADRLPVQAVFELEQPITFSAHVTSQGRLETPFVLEAERAFATHLRNVIRGVPLLTEPPVPSGVALADPRPALPTPATERPFGPDEIPTREELETALSTLPEIEPREAIFPEGGVIAFHPGNITLVTGDEETALILDEGVVVQYWDRVTQQTLQISAQRAVAFLKPGPLTDLAGFTAEDVRGIYLEGDVVATDGQYTLRGPRVYYDVQANRALVLDAVFWTYDAKRRLPLYVRAESIRQEAAREFSMTKGVISNTAFFQPHFSIGVQDVTLSRRDRDGEMRNIVDARHLTLRALGVPFFWLPGFEGDPENIPLRDLRFENSSGSGSAVKTRWDLFALLGVDHPEWLNADLLADIYFERGPAIGAYTVWDEEDFDGSLFGYVVAYDTGDDLLRNGTERERDGETRGMVVGEHRWKLSDTWTLLLEGSYMSDETFVDAFFEQLAWTHREFRTGLVLRRQAANTLLSLEASGNLNDFIVSDHLLQSRGYSVEKMPEFAYHQVANDLFPGIQEGLVTHTWEARLSRMRLDFDKQTPSNYGFENSRLANQFLGADPDQSIADALRETGLSEELVHRFDTRQEFSTTFDVGPIRFRPYTVGRLTAYDDDFDDYAPDQDETTRLWGSVGVEASTTLTKIDDDVESDFFDLHRIRHTVRPSVTLWHSESTIDAVELPVYDDDVESITEGTAVRVAVDQTWQTKRGGPGRWRDEDVFQLGVEYVHFGTDSDRQSPIGRWFDWRPELSNPGEFFGANGLWKATNSLAFTGETVFDFETSQQARSSVGVIVDHSPNFSSFVELRFLNAQDSTFIDVGSRYTLSSKYAIAWIASYDDKRDDLQQVAADIERLFPNAVVQVGVRYNNITDEFSFGFGFQPRGLQGRGVRLQGIGSSNQREQRSGF